jgi:hypothetical protein
MKKRSFPGLKMILIFLAVGALVLAVQPIETMAGKGKPAKDDNNPPPASSGDTAEGICGVASSGADIVDPQGDSDGDGVSNLCECSGILPGTPCSPPAGSQLIVEGYLSQFPDNTLNPVVKSVFVTLARISDVDPSQQSLIPWPVEEDATEAFGCLSRAADAAGTTTGGLGANVIVVPYGIAQTLPDGWVTNQVKLLWIEESLLSVPYLGKCDNSWGTPETVGKCWVFTERAMLDQFKNTICHECAHALMLRGLYVYEAGGYHHLVEDLVHDSQFVDLRRKGPRTTFYFGTGFPSTIDVDDFTPWEPL